MLEGVDLVHKSNILHADLMIVAGTSLTVEPASSLLRIFNGKHLVIINNSII